MVRTTPMRNLSLKESAVPQPEQSPNQLVVRPQVEIHPFPNRDGLLLNVQPPREPRSPTVQRVPCDIVLVIDVSSSMGDDAPLPGGTTEKTGLTVLDLTKHAARTIIATLDQRDRLGIVTFSSDATVYQRLIPMTDINKKESERVVERILLGSLTNLWCGITEGLKLFQDKDVLDSKNVPALMVLTDGQPNHMHPQPGYIPKLRKMQPFAPTIHTFGFGYTLRSGLLKSIAEMSGGNYSFIPDAGMIGTVFVHAVANLQSTYATEAVLTVTYPKYLELEETTGPAVHKELPVDYDTDQCKLTIRLGNLQYGQSRDIYLRNKPFDFPVEADPIVHANLEYRQQGTYIRRPGVKRSMLESITLPPEEIAYHISRSAIISYIASLSPLNAVDEHKPIHGTSAELKTKFDSLLDGLPALEYPNDPQNKSLIQDLTGEDPFGQISMAVSCHENYARWGSHYLPSLGGAYARQICNSFRDPGPLMFGADSPLFIEHRDALDAAFESLPPPTPSKRYRTTYSSKFSMRSYHSRDIWEACFAACSMVELAREVHGDSLGGGKMIPISRLRAGMSVRTPQGPRRVKAVLRTPVRQARMCLVGDLVVTAWHPISLDGKVWTFPKHIAQRSVRYTGSIYSVLLQRDSDVEAAALMVGGLWGVTLGHGLLVDPGTAPDPRAHTFFGDYDLVVKALSGLHRTRNGLFLGGGVHRDPQTGLVDGFERVSLPARPLAQPVSQSKSIRA